MDGIYTMGEAGWNFCVEVLRLLPWVQLISIIVINLSRKRRQLLGKDTENNILYSTFLALLR